MGRAFWRGWWSSSPEPSRPLPDDVGLPTGPRPPAGRGDDDSDEPDRPLTGPAPRTSGATPGDGPDRRDEPALTAPDAADLDRTALVAAGEDVVAAVRAADGRRGPAASRVLAVAATGALAARLPPLSGIDGAAGSDEPEDELLHAYADLVVARSESRRAATAVDRADLLAVAHVAAAAAAIDAAGDPALLLLAGVPADVQLRAAALLLAQTADDGGGPPDALRDEVRTLFGASG